MKKRIILLLLVLSMCCGLFVRIDALPCEQMPSISAGSAILIDASDCSVLYEKNANEKKGMASTTKVMTALIVAECMELDTVVSISEKAVGIEGSSIYLTAGERLTVRQLLYALLLSSANDAATALAIACSGSVEAFVEKMNQRAESMGLESTHFMNPHGLYHEEHYTTAYELALISVQALNHPTIREIASTYKMYIPKDGNPKARLCINHNKMLKLYDGAIGLKTGFTKATGRCLVSAAERDGLSLVAVTLNAPSDWNDHSAMLDFGFGNFEAVTLYDVGEFKYALPITGGKDSYVIISNSEAIKLTLPKLRENHQCAVYASKHFEYAPIPAGKVLGELKCSVGERVIRSPLVSAYEVGSAAKEKNLFEKIFGFFAELFT